MKIFYSDKVLIKGQQKTIRRSLHKDTRLSYFYHNVLFTLRIKGKKFRNRNFRTFQNSNFNIQYI